YSSSDAFGGGEKTITRSGRARRSIRLSLAFRRLVIGLSFFESLVLDSRSGSQAGPSQVHQLDLRNAPSRLACLQYPPRRRDHPLPGVFATIVVEEFAGLGWPQAVDQTSELRHALDRGDFRVWSTHVGLHPAWIDDHASDAAWCEVDGQAAHHHVHRRLRAAIRDRATRRIVGKRSHAAGKGDYELPVAAGDIFDERL